MVIVAIRKCLPAGLWSTLILAACAVLADAERWRAADQPDLQQALEHAPLLETESLGEPARGVNVWERWMVPNHDGQSWDVLQVYFNESGG